ncbi:hypothetical protein CLORY_27880 [Clostridium oryzae]|uniref:YhhN-like protein n=1 Tax=Clostridium oryzae TaxID=1450648 RepID=A0A1V4IKT4_9CLOT|nr:hypothetical protein CLORY_27880 [Clostridium oryzae]
MQYIKSFNNYIKISVISIAMLYLVFLYSDFTGVYSLVPTYILKYICIILSFSITLAYSRSYLNKKDLFLIRAALFFTLVSDFFLVVENKFILGVMFFCIVQFFHTLRYSRNSVYIVILRFSISFLTIFSIYILLNFADKKIDIIIPLALFYFTCLLTSVYFSITAFKKRLFPLPNNVLIVMGMTLFLLCDINVGIFNITPMIDSNYWIVKFLYSLSSNLIWFFYAPSQLFLAISGIDFGSSHPINKQRPINKQYEH